MAINWFPGHMAKTRREIKENLKLVDVIIEMRDARIIRSSRNPDIEEIYASKPRIILLNKRDLAEESITKLWTESLSKDNIAVLPVNCSTAQGLKNIKIEVNQLLEEKHIRMKKKGISKITDRAMVVGIPNVGKSSLINKLAGGRIAKIGDKPGVTKSKQWIKTKLGIELMDTPGILWPRLGNEETRLNLAFTGAIKDEIMDVEELTLNLVKFLCIYYPDRLKTRYKLDRLSQVPLENIENIARKRGAIVSGGKVDYNRVSILILDEFRGGKLGPISLERP